MPQYYKILDNGQSNQKAENKRFNRLRPKKKNNRRRADGSTQAGDWEAAWSVQRQAQNAHKKVMNQAKASRAAAGKKKK